MEQRIPFNQLFQQLPDGSLTPLRIISINNVVMGPGVIFQDGALFGGVDISRFIGRDFATRTENNVVIILGVYNQ